jgi:hypothetical protein
LSNLKFLIVTVVLTLFFSTIFNSDFLALNDKFNISQVKVDSTKNSISVSWGAKADKFVIYLDDEKFKTTTESNISVQNLKSNHPYEIVVQALSNQKVSDTIAIQTITPMTDKQEEDKVYEIASGIATAIFSDDEAKIIFENVPDENKVYDVSRNNKKIGVINQNKNFIIDKNLEEKTEYRYSVLGKVKLKDKEIQEVKKVFKKNDVDIDQSEVEKIDRELELARTIKTLPKEKNTVSAEKWSDPSQGVQFMYTTFIPMSQFNFTPAYGLTSPYHTFLGDGRSFDSHAIDTRFRTRTKLRVSFPESGGSIVRFDKLANETDGFNVLTRRWNSKLANMSEVYLRSKHEGSTSAYFHIHHNAKNPLHDIFMVADAPGITYDIEGHVYKSGSFSLVGSHDNAPNHELSFTPIPGEVHTWWSDFHNRIIVGESTMRALFQDNMDKKRGFYRLLDTPYTKKQINEQGYWK